MRAWLFLLGAVTVAQAAETALPAPLDPNRYEPMMAQSPFALATVAAAPPAPTESFAANWNLTGLAKLPDSSGVSHDFVTVRSRDARVSFSLYGDEVSQETDAEGVSLAGVQWNLGEPRKSVVTLKRGAEFAKVEFGQESAPAQPAPMPTPGMPPRVALPAGAAASRPFGAPPAAVRPILPQPSPRGSPGMNGSPGMGGGNPGMNGNNSARKPRVISSPPQ